MLKPKAKFTYKDYANAPEGKRYELLGGDLVVVPAPSICHQQIGLRPALPEVF